MTTPSRSASGRGWQRVDGIDLLRGLSILFVLMNHVNMRLLGAHVPYTKGLPAQLVYSLVWNGQFGVQIFFVISGYLITTTSMRRWGTPGNLSVKDFYLLRVARIAPLMLMLLLVLSAMHFARVPGYIVSAKTGGLPRALMAALTFHINLLEATKHYLPANWDILWSLSVEEMFYLFFPLVARMLPRKRFLLPLLGLFIVAGPFARAKAFNPNPVWREYSYLGGMDAIAFGCLAAMLTAGRYIARKWVHLCGWAGTALLVFSLCFSINAYQWGLGRNGTNMTILAAGAALMIVTAAQSQWHAQRILLPIQVLGQRSYEIYLTHMFGIMSLFAAFVHFGKPMKGVPILFLLAVLAAGALGWLVATLFAEPMNRTLRRHFHAGGAVLGSAQPEVD